MNLSDIASIKPAVEKQLARDEWTVAKLASTTAPTLVKYKGVGLKVAGQIIAEAREMVHQLGLEESTVRPEAQETQGLYLAPIKEEIQMSPRVRRAIMSSDRRSDK